MHFTLVGNESLCYKWSSYDLTTLTKARGGGSLKLSAELRPRPESICGLCGLEDKLRGELRITSGGAPMIPLLF